MAKKIVLSNTEILALKNEASKGNVQALNKLTDELFACRDQVKDLTWSISNLTAVVKKFEKRGK